MEVLAKWKCCFVGKFAGDELVCCLFVVGWSACCFPVWSACCFPVGGVLVCLSVCCLNCQLVADWSELGVGWLLAVAWFDRAWMIVWWAVALVARECCDSLVKLLRG